MPRQVSQDFEHAAGSKYEYCEYVWVTQDSEYARIKREYALIMAWHTRICLNNSEYA